MKKLHFVSALSVLSIAVGSSLPAVAGEGAAAGAATYRLNNVSLFGVNFTQVTGSAVAGAVGKSNASAAAFNSSTSNLSATAHGSAGTLNTFTTVEKHDTYGGTDPNYAAQQNTLTPAGRFASGAPGNDQVKF